MNKEKLGYMYTSGFESMVIRPEIRNLLIVSDKVQRFTGDDLPQGVILDTVFTHTRRCMETAGNLHLPFDQQQTVKTTLMIHDIPEVIAVLASGKTADTTSPEKESFPENDKLIAEREYEIAEAVFTPIEFELYKYFEESGNYLKGKTYENHYVNIEGIIAQLIDKTDANLTLHFQMSRWALTENYDPTQIMSGRSLSYVFRQQKRFLPKLTGVPLDFYKSTMNKIIKMWREVKERGIPLPKEINLYID